MPKNHVGNNFMRRIPILLALILSWNLFAVPSVLAAPLADVTNNKVTFDFPTTATFSSTINSDSEIQAIVLEYGNQQQTCGDVIAKAFPQFTPAKTVNVKWTWDMRQSGSLPPGAQIWWRWRVTDSSGKETVSETKTITWLDNIHPWKILTSGQLSLHYYNLQQSFAQEMLNAGTEGIQRNAKDAGLTTKDPVDIYVYPNYDDLKEAILYEPSWVGGQAYPEQNIVILGTSGSDSNWDKDTVIHELTHVLVGHFTFSCLGDVPQWLNEGLAVYSEGPLDPQFQGPLDEAVQNDTLLSVRSISGSFSEVANKADLSYAESYSLVNFLITKYGHEKMTALLASLRDGLTTEEALQQTYGFGIDGLEDAWRQSLGAKPRTAAAPTAQPTPTYVPTIVPVSGAPLVLQVTPTPIPTSTINQSATPTSPATRVGPPLALTLIVLALCCAFLLLIGVFVLALVIRRNQNMKGGNNG